jgi:HlyD family secretion protein
MASFLSRSAVTVRSASSRSWAYAKSHKIISAIVLVIVLGGGYMVYAKEAKDATTTQYVLAAAANEPIETTVTASGEVSANHQLDLSPKASGEVTGVYVKAGDSVKAGQLLVSIDDTDAEKTLRDAQLSLQSAQISYTQSITSAQNTSVNNQTSLSTATGNGFDTAASVETDIATILPGIDTILNGSSDVPKHGGSFSNAYVDIIDSEAPNAETLRDQARASLDTAQASYQQTTTLYQAANRASSASDITALLQSMQQTAAKTNQAVKDANAFLNLVNDTVTQHDLLTVPPSLSSQMTSLSSYTSKANSDTSSVASAISSISNAQQDVASDQQSISGGTPLAIQSAQLSLAKAKQAVSDAQSDLADYVVRAPFDGTVAQVDVQKFDQASGKVLTLITTQQYADISLNETDISKVRAGQKATLTFDAIDGLTINGTVAEVDQIGTVSSGVSTYTVKIGFDTQDARVLPGMTVNATIITASKASALVVPSSAVKSTSLNGQTRYYVEVATASSTAARKIEGAASSSPRFAAFPGRTGTSTASTTHTFGAGAAGGFGGAARTQTVAADAVTIRRVPVTIGLQSDTMTEITSGLSAGQLVVSQSLNASGATTKANSGLFGLFGGSKNPAARTQTGTIRAGAGAVPKGANAGFGGGAAAGGFGGGAGFSGRGG